MHAGGHSHVHTHIHTHTLLYTEKKFPNYLLQITKSKRPLLTRPLKDSLTIHTITSNCIQEMF